MTVVKRINNNNNSSSPANRAQILDVSNALKIQFLFYSQLGGINESNMPRGETAVAGSFKQQMMLIPVIGTQIGTKVRMPLPKRPRPAISENKKPRPPQ